MKQDILCVGAPRSGNTWLSRLVAEALQCPVTGFKNAVPLAREGLDRKSNFVVRQLHLRPIVDKSTDKALLTGRHFAINNRTTERIILIIRDPRDVAVSAYYYWQVRDLQTTIRAVATGDHPYGFNWWKYTSSWMEQSNIAITRYEWLYADTNAELKRLLCTLNVKPRISIDKVVTNQDINIKRRQIQRDGASRPYGKGVQLKHLRKGVTGDWRNHFKQHHRKLAFDYWQPQLVRLGYEMDNSWL